MRRHEGCIMKCKGYRVNEGNGVGRALYRKRLGVDVIGPQWRLSTSPIPNAKAWSYLISRAVAQELQ